MISEDLFPPSILTLAEPFDIYKKFTAFLLLLQQKLSSATSLQGVFHLKCFIALETSKKYSKTHKKPVTFFPEGYLELGVDVFLLSFLTYMGSGTELTGNIFSSMFSVLLFWATKVGGTAGMVTGIPSFLGGRK